MLTAYEIARICHEGDVVLRDTLGFDVLPPWSNLHAQGETRGAVDALLAGEPVDFRGFTQREALFRGVCAALAPHLAGDTPHDAATNVKPHLGAESAEASSVPEGDAAP